MAVSDPQPLVIQPADSVFVTAVVYLPNLSALPLSAKSFVARTKTRTDGTIAVTLGSFNIETSDNEERQKQLAGALTALWDIFVVAGFWPKFEAHSEEVILSISLNPLGGQAGIAIAPGSLSRWMEANAELHVNAYPSH